MTIASSDVVESVVTATDGFGNWRARVALSRPIVPGDRCWPAVRRAARAAIIGELTAREQRTWETPAQTEHRLRQALPRLRVIGRDTDRSGAVRTVTLGEA